jgi:hypothetical protein
MLAQVDPKLDAQLHLKEPAATFSKEPQASDFLDAIITPSTPLQQMYRKLQIGTPVLYVPVHHSRSSAVRALPTLDAPLHTVCYFGSFQEPAMVKAVRAWATTHNATFKVQAPICGICSLLDSATH